MILLVKSRLQLKLVLAFSLTILIPVAIISLYSSLRSQRILIERVSAEQLRLADARAKIAESSLNDASIDLLFLLQAPALRHDVDRPHGTKDAIGELNELFSAFLDRSSDRYLQLCLLDIDGTERTCVQNNAGNVQITPANELQSRLDMPYVLNALRLTGIPGEQPVYISEVDHRDPDQMQAPPVLHYATLIQDDEGIVDGVLVLSANAQSIFDNLIDTTPNVQTTIVDVAGDYLFSTAATDGPLAKVLPQDAELILRQERGVLSRSHDQPDSFQVFTRVRPRGQSAIQWTVLYNQPRSAILLQVYQTELVILLIAVAALLAALIVAGLLTRSIVRPVRALVTAAERVGAGDLHTPITVSSSDEIGILASTFNRTVGRLRESVDALERRRREAETLHTVALALSASLDLHRVLDMILKELRTVVYYDSGTVQLLRDGTSEIIRAYGHIRPDELIGQSFALLLNASPNAEVASTRAPVILSDAPERFPHFRHMPYDSDPIRTWMGVPLLFGDRLIGMITLDRHKPNAYTDDHAQLALAFAAQAAMAIENARLYESAQAEIAERSRSAQDLARLSAIIESTPDAVGMADMHGGTLFINRAARVMFGLGSTEEVFGRSIFSYIPDWYRQILTEEVLPTVLREGSWLGEGAVLGPQGEEIPVSQVIILHRRADGSPERLSTIIRDISERKRFEEKQRQTEKMEALGRLAGGLAHDFNNILTVISGECDLMLSEIELNDDLRIGLEQINASSTRAAALTRQLLAFSRRQVLQPVLVNLNDVVTAMSQMLRRLIGEDVLMETSLSHDLWQVQADPNQLEQVLMNLAVNARDAMPYGGRLLIETCNVRVEAAELGELAPGAYVCLLVRDSGAGIDPASRDHVFEPFFSTKPRGKGTGLGLATVHGIIEQSGGRIQFESQPGQGTTFLVHLPAAPLAPGVSTLLAHSQTAIAKSRSETVLLVEDDERVRRLTCDVLLRQGLEVLVAPDGVEAQLRAAQHSGAIHLLLTDIVMPGGINGVQLAQALRSSRPTLQIIYMSGYADNAQVAESLHTEGAYYLQKPFAPRDLADLVQHVLDAGKDALAAG